MKRNIVTGQQIGLLGGPLFTTYKVLGVISLSRKLQARAVYWLETNDADFEEINHIEYLDALGKPVSLRWKKNSLGYSCGFIEVDEKLVALLNHFFKSVRQTEFTPVLREIALEAYQPGKNLGQASKELADILFAVFDVEVFDPRDKVFMAASRDLLLRETRSTPDQGQCNTFCIIDQKRVALFRRGSDFTDREGQVIDLEKYDLLPNVKTRNVIQDRYFNTSIYVAGPSEMAYIGGLDDRYAFHRVCKPEIVPRMSVTLVEPKIRRILHQFGISAQEVSRVKKDDFLKRVQREGSGFDYQLVLAESRRRTEEYLGKIQQLGLNTKPLRMVLNRSVKEIAGRRRAEVKKQLRGLLEKANLLYDYLMPFGKPQERVFNLFYYMNLYGGTDFLTWLLNHYDVNLSVLEIENET